MIAFHPVSQIFPLMQANELAELAADISANGLREPIWLHRDGQVIDGRNRCLACELAGASIDTRIYEGDDAGLVAFVVSLNLHRRHLSESQRMVVAAKIANFEHGGDRRSDQAADLPLVSQAAAAEMLNVSERGVRSAKDVLIFGAPELVSAVERGTVSVSAAADVAQLPHDQQREIVARGEREILAAAKEIRAERAETRRQERIERLIEISKGNAPLDTSRHYPVLYADPPWRYEHPPMGDTDRSIENHYPTMTLEEICALRVAEIATDDAILYLWATAPKLAECMQVIEAWGFTYRTCMVWVKDKIGMGYWVRNQHEILLIAKRGEMPLPAVDARPSSVVFAARTEHSVKPEEFYALIERMYPGLPKIELFAIGLPFADWAIWGNQAVAA